MYAEKRTPERMCVICRKRFPKGELQRHVACEASPAAPGGLAHDPRQSRTGRGYYVCADETCLRRFAGFRARRKNCKGVAHGR